MRVRLEAEAAALEGGRVVDERAGHLHACAAPFIAAARTPCLSTNGFGRGTAPVAAGPYLAGVPCLAATPGP